MFKKVFFFATTITNSILYCYIPTFFVLSSDVFGSIPSILWCQFILQICINNEVSIDILDEGQNYHSYAKNWFGEYGPWKSE